MKKLQSFKNLVQNLVKYAGYFVIIFETLSFLNDKLEQKGITDKTEDNDRLKK